MASVELEHAWTWKCPTCGEANFSVNKTVKPTEADLREQFAVQPYDEVPEDLGGAWYSVPDEVMCRGCSAVFDAEDPNEE